MESVHYLDDCESIVNNGNNGMSCYCNDEDERYGNDMYNFIMDILELLEEGEE